MSATSQYSRRKSTLRETLRHSRSSKPQTKVQRLKGKHLFRTLVKLVIEYKEWIKDLSSEKIGDDVTANVKLAQRKKTKDTDKDLNLKDRSILLIPPDKRSKEEIEYIQVLLREIKAFKRYPEAVRDALASDCIYQYVPPGRTITRQGHEPKALYYVVKGELQILRDDIDQLTGEVHHIEVGDLLPGDTFGEISLLHRIERTATVVSKTSADLLIIRNKVFDEHLKSLLLEEWDVLKDALVNFNYFKGWTQETMRECCILSKAVKFKPNEILLGDGQGMIHYVYFLLSGECRLIEHMLIEKKHVRNKVKYKMYKTDQESVDRQRVSRFKKIEFEDNELPSLILGSESDDLSQIGGMKRQTSVAAGYIKKAGAKKQNVAMERLSVLTVTLQDVINEWHEITDAVEMLMRQPSVSSLQNYPTNVQTVFMQICIFYRGACFGLGEQMKNRRIVSITPCKCLLIPRYWLTQHNRANIWERVKHFMDTKFPKDYQLFQKCMANRKWAKYGRNYCENVVTNGRYIPNDNKIYNVPYSIRVNENIIEDEKLK